MISGFNLTLSDSTARFLVPEEPDTLAELETALAATVEAAAALVLAMIK